MKARFISVAAATLMLGVAAVSAQDAPAPNPFMMAPPTKLSYDKEFPALHYERMPADNPVALLQKKLDSGEVKLQFVPGQGYLASLLKALAIDVSSQTLVYSKTSLQKGSITAATPRAVYFNTDTYVGYVQGRNQDTSGRPDATVLEIATLDSRLGQVFYTLDNGAPAGPQPGAARIERQTVTCLSCHDTYEMGGGGVPRFLLMSSYVDIHGNQLTHEDQILTEDETPLKYRWGGWYVTGRTGKQVHVGNIQVHQVQELVDLEHVRRGNLDTLDELFDTKPYPTDKSDVVALLVLQHQVTVQNLITRVNFEARQALAAAGKGGPAALPEKKRQQLDDWIGQLADALTFANFAAITDSISGNSGFDRWFQAQGPRDGQGRSLRELDLHDRLFRYPVSYLINTSAFDALPDYAREQVYGHIAKLLLSRMQDPTRPPATAADRAAALEILRATRPEFAKYLAARRG